MSPAQALTLQGSQSAAGSSDVADPAANRNPLKRAAGLHRMAYHRARLRHILHQTLQELQESGAIVAVHSYDSCSYVGLMLLAHGLKEHIGTA